MHTTSVSKTIYEFGDEALKNSRVNIPMKMFINPLENVKFCCIVPDDANFGKFTCMYCLGNHIQQYTRHQKGGFNSHAEAINWFLERFPDGNVLHVQSFLEMQAKFLLLKLPAGPNQLDPLHMTERPRPQVARRTRDGKIVSDFE